MAREGNNIISFDDARRMSARSSRPSGANGPSARATQRSSTSGARPRGLDYSQELPEIGDPFSGLSRVSRSGRIAPIGSSSATPRRAAGSTRSQARAPQGVSSRAGLFDEEADLSSARVSSRPARSRAGAAGSRAQGSSRASAGASSNRRSSRSSGALSDSASASRGASARPYRRAADDAFDLDADVQPRAALERFDEDDLDQEDAGAHGRSKAQRRKKQKQKQKAEKMFARQFGSDAAAPESSGSRAAVYKGEMGRSHKRAFADLGGTAKRTPSQSSRGSASKAREKAPIPKLAVLAGVIVCLAVTLLFLYPTARQYYVEVRTQDKLQAEYEAIQQRNEAIQGDIDRLSTEEGIKDAAREQLGWVEEGDTAVVVEGLDENASAQEKEAVYAQVLNGSIPTPQTWYSPVLDVVFGYSDSTGSVKQQSADASEGAGASDAAAEESAE